MTGCRGVQTRAPASIYGQWQRTRSPPRAWGELPRIGGLAAGQAIRQAGTRAANVTRSTPSSARLRSISARSRPPSRSWTALGTMKGAAMKLGQVLSFLDVGLVPEEHRDEFQRKL